jgi:hypothetical protein
MRLKLLGGSDEPRKYESGCSGGVEPAKQRPHDAVRETIDQKCLPTTPVSRLRVWKKGSHG